MCLSMEYLRQKHRTSKKRKKEKKKTTKILWESLVQVVVNMLNNIQKVHTKWLYISIKTYRNAHLQAADLNKLTTTLFKTKTNTFKKDTFRFWCVNVSTRTLFSFVSPTSNIQQLVWLSDACVSLQGRAGCNRPGSFWSRPCSGPLCSPPSRSSVCRACGAARPSCTLWPGDWLSGSWKTKDDMFFFFVCLLVLVHLKSFRITRTQLKWIFFWGPIY